MKTSLSALTGKRCGPEMSDPADIEQSSVKSKLKNANFQNQLISHWGTHFAASFCNLDVGSQCSVFFNDPLFQLKSLYPVTVLYWKLQVFESKSDIAFPENSWATRRMSLLELIHSDLTDILNQVQRARLYITGN